MCSGLCGSKIQTPEIHCSVLKFQPQLPTFAAFVTSPDQHGFARILIDEIHQEQSLSHRKTLGNHRETSLRAGVYRIAFGASCLPALRPFHGHRHTELTRIPARAFCIRESNLEMFPTATVLS